jgi:hypothetical protein
MRRSIAIFAVSFAFGCQGSIFGESAGQAGPGGTPPPNGGGSSGSTAAAGTGPTGTGTTDPGAPGRTPMRRLTITEYVNTIRDLLGEDASALVDGFPADGSGTEGFDNTATTLGAATNQVDVFEHAAEALAARAVASGSPARQRISVCAEWADAACRRNVLQSFADKAWRRPTTSVEVEQLLALAAAGANAGASVDEQVALALRGILIAPQFLFRVEKLPPAGTAGSYRVSAHELATRLSYFLWSSTPDDELAKSAAAGNLASADDVTREVSRMLASDKASAFTENFAAQWLALRTLGDHRVDAGTFPAYSSALAASMAKETKGLFSHVLANGLPASELLTATYGFVDQPLAQFYGVSMTGGRAELGATERRGLLGQGALLTLTSFPNRTSVVRRGVWVLENLLCTEAPVPPEIQELKQDPAVGTLRERMKQHSTNPACAGCHTLMDPIGFGLENFDAIGRYREAENGVSIDASSTHAGHPFSKPSELAQLIAEDPTFVACLTKRLFTFGLGRTLTTFDQAAAAAVAQGSGAQPALRDLVAHTAQSQVFAQQEVEP